MRPAVRLQVSNLPESSSSPKPSVKTSPLCFVRIYSHQILSEEPESLNIAALLDDTASERRIYQHMCAICSAWSKVQCNLWPQGRAAHTLVRTHEVSPFSWLLKGTLLECFLIYSIGSISASGNRGKRKVVDVGHGEL